MFDNLIWDGPASLADLQGYWLAPQPGPDEPLRELNLAVIDRTSGTMIGGVSLRPSVKDNAVADIGYTLAPAFHGRGFGTEAVAELCRYAIDDRGFERIEAGVFVGNTASSRVLEKCGFKLEGTRRRVNCKRGVWLDNWMYGLTAPEWRAR